MSISSVDPITFANYTIQELLDIPTIEYSTITAAQISALSKEKMRAIHINWLSDSALAGLTAQNITGITDSKYFSEWIWPAQMALISKAAFEALEKDQLGAIKPESFAALTVDQLLKISDTKYSVITASQISALSKEKMHAIHINWLSDSALAGLTAQNITGITDLRYFSEWIWPAQMALISKVAFEALEKAQLSAIKPESFASLTFDQLLKISDTKYSAITASQISALSKEKMRAIHIDWLSDSALAGLTAQNITGITDLRYFSEWIWPAQMSLIKPSAIAALTTAQFTAIKRESLAALTDEQWKARLSNEPPTASVTQNQNLSLNLSVAIAKTSIQGSTSGGDSIGEKIELTLNFDQAVYGLVGSTDHDIFSVGGNKVNTSWSGIAGSAVRKLTYTVEAGQNGLATIDESALKNALLAGLIEASGKLFTIVGSIVGLSSNSNTLPIVDTTRPDLLTLTAEDTASSNGLLASQNVLKVGGIEENASWFYSVDSFDWTLGGSDQYLHLANGTHSYFLKQMDAAGNDSNVRAYVAEWSSEANRLLQLMSIRDIPSAPPLIGFTNPNGGTGFYAMGNSLLATHANPSA